MRCHLHRRGNAAERDRGCRSLLCRGGRLRDRALDHQLQGHRREEHRSRLHQRMDSAARSNAMAWIATSSMSSRIPSFCAKELPLPTFSIPTASSSAPTASARQRCLSDIYAPLTSGEYYKRADAIAGSCTVAEPPPLLLTSTKSAEIIKHASNAFLALKISFINAVSNLCEATDANVEQVARGMGLDSRIGPKFLRPGIGYGGSCFPKDVAAFRSVAEQMGIDFSSSERSREDQRSAEESAFSARFAQLCGPCAESGSASLAWRSKERPTIFASLRQSSSSSCCLREGCSIAAFDPAAMKRTQERLPASTSLRYAIQRL